MTLGCKDIGIRKSEFVAKLNFFLENTTGLNDLKEWILGIFQENDFWTPPAPPLSILYMTKLK